LWSWTGRCNWDRNGKHDPSSTDPRFSCSFTCWWTHRNRGSTFTSLP
jgi:hypothetical protein